MWRRFSSRAKELVSHFFRKPQGGTSIDDLYRARDYLDAYSEHTDIRVGLAPHEAVGGKWEEIGRLQFEFLVGNGLRPHHRMLDIGCGTLRGGRHFIRYLEAGSYCGLDISAQAIQYARQLVTDEGLSDKHPMLVVSNRDLKFTEFSGRLFDYLLAQSVFTHLMPQHIEECFAYVGGLMSRSSVFFFTFWEAAQYTRTGPKAFSYPYSFFQSLAERHGFTIRNLSAEYKHPRGQRMAVLQSQATRHKSQD